MTRIAIFKEQADPGDITYRAITSGQHAAGRTAGEALDALTSLLPGDRGETLVIVRDLAPDRFFGEVERRRLEDLMDRWRTARDSGSSLSNNEQAELECLIDTEVRAASDRAAALAHELNR
jgi:hypothetical protein